jgi:two-component system sensor histidine kinase DesK
VWLVFILVPLVTAITNSGPNHGLVIAAAAVFTVAYTWMVLILFRDGKQRLQWVLGAVQVTVAIALTLADRSGWGFLFTYCAACAALVAPAGYSFAAVAAVSVLAVVTSLLGGASQGAAIGYGASSIGVGLLLVLMRDLRMRNQELTEARAELARAAVLRERERFARDLHDLLGQTLSVIALKAELAGRLLPDRPGDARTEVGEVEQVARQALQEVRLAVSGYRLPTLDGELAGARMALSAAGIEACVERESVTLDPEVEAVLAWAVREGATNVIRHSGARHCTVKVVAGLDGAEVEVLDDGQRSTGVGDEALSAGTAVNGHGAEHGGGDGPGHGLAGLGERAETLRGHVAAGPIPGGGFRLAVTVPLTAGGR